MEPSPTAFHSRVLAFAKRLSELLSPGKDEYLSYRYSFDYDPARDVFIQCQLSDADEIFSIWIHNVPPGYSCAYIGKEPSERFEEGYNEDSIDSVEDIARRVGERRRWKLSGEWKKSLSEMRV